MSENREEVVNRWISQFDFPNVDNHWVISMRLSTVPMENWFYRRNQLKADSTKIDISIPCHGHWCVTLEPHDKLYQVQWRPDGHMTVESQQLKYRRRIKWPTLASLQDLPHLIEQIEAVMDIHFIRHVDVTTMILDVEDVLANAAFKHWLSPCADTLGQLYRNP